MAAPNPTTPTPSTHTLPHHLPFPPQLPHQVRGIPTLVILDGATGELITANGRDAVGDDPACDNFPWRPRTLAQIMDGCPLVPAAGGEPIPNALEAMKGKVTLFYFSASW